MKFIPDGPDIPIELLTAHERGEVVFFCGAGISKKAGLPLFSGLVDQIYENCCTYCAGKPFANDNKNIVGAHTEYAAYLRGQYDVVLNLLEQRLPGGRQALMNALVSALKPNFNLAGATEGHEALLSLATDRHSNHLRLVTTNYDSVFHEAANRRKISLENRVCSAPDLPYLQGGQWDSLVFLHGLLSDVQARSGKRLVLTSGDFGAAYLMERWASRFVSDLFLQYDVCFVGYSANDPVMLYILSALQLSNSGKKIWVFTGYKSEAERSAAEAGWISRGITPVFYDCCTGHQRLYDTLTRWAELYKLGIDGKLELVENYAGRNPLTDNDRDFFVPLMLWALTDPSGKPAETFANINPVPRWEWHTVFTDPKQCSPFLPALGSHPLSVKNENLFCRTVNSNSASRLALTTNDIIGPPRLDAVMLGLMHWVLRFVGDARCLLWLAQLSGRLQIQFRTQLWVKLNAIGRNGITNAVAVRSGCQSAPDEYLRKLWDLLLAGRIDHSPSTVSVGDWIELFEMSGLTFACRSMLQDNLRPRIHLYEIPPRYRSQETQDSKSFIGAKIVLGSSISSLREAQEVIKESPFWKKSVVELANEFEQLLCETLRLQKEAGLSESSCEVLPSVASHAQNEYAWEWAPLIEFLRDSWDSVRDQDETAAVRMARCWIKDDSNTFKRLALYAATQCPSIAVSEWSQWLQANLWCIDLRREICRLLVSRGRELVGTELQDLEAKILKGDEESVNRDWSCHLFLNKLRRGGAVLSQNAIKIVGDSSDVAADDELNEFPSLCLTNFDAGYREHFSGKRAPCTKAELKIWLKQPKNFERDDWEDVCCRDAQLTYGALRELADENEWPAQRWLDALYQWHAHGKVNLSRQKIADTIKRMLAETFAVCLSAIACWLTDFAKTEDVSPTEVENLCQRVITTLKQRTTASAENSRAESAAGHVAEALIVLLRRKRISRKGGIPENYQKLLNELCYQDRVFCSGASRLAAYFYELLCWDPMWTAQTLIPMFHWRTSPYAAEAWQQFLHQNQVVKQKSLYGLKQDFIETAQHYSDLESAAEFYVVRATKLALFSSREFDVDDFRRIFECLPAQAFGIVFRTLREEWEVLAKKDERVQFWDEHFMPFWRRVLPKDRRLITPDLQRAIADFLIVTQELFPAATEEFQYWLTPAVDWKDLVQRIGWKGFCWQDPKAAKALLNLITPDSRRSSEDYQQALQNIETAAAENIQAAKQCLRIRQQ